jgi:hypothetical protein
MVWGMAAGEVDHVPWNCSRADPLHRDSWRSTERWLLKAVLKPYGATFDNRTHVTYPTLDYCTQYRETDFAFASRFAGFFICWP